MKLWALTILMATALVGSGRIALAQTRTIFGVVKDAATGKTIPFPHLLADSKTELLGDMEGSFVMQVPASARHLTVKAYMYLDGEVELGPGDSVNVYLFYAHPFTFQSITAPHTRRLIRDIVRSKKRTDPRQETNYQYTSYNKVVITTQYMSALKLHLNHLLSLLGKKPMQMFGNEHHIMLMESAGQRRFRSRYKQKERIVASKISGINRPPGLSLAAAFEPVSVFEPYMRIGTKRYISPLAGRPNKRYIFYVLDTIMLDTQQVYVVKFNPRSLRNKELLQGFLYISSRPLGVLGFHMWPAFDKESTFSLLQQCRQLPSGRWFPSEVKTVYQRSSLGGLKIPVEASSKTYIFNMDALDKSQPADFDEIIFDFQKDSLLALPTFPAPLRQERLTPKDKSTYEFFDHVGSISAVDQYLNFGQKLVAGRIPFGWIDLVFKRAITVNDVEGLRLGLGLQTTEKLSETHQGGGYFARGLNDNRSKFGLNYQFNLTSKHGFALSYQNDLIEPGITTFAFQKNQYPSENLRNIRISRFDALEHVEIAHLAHWLPNVRTRLGLDIGRRNYLYTYTYLPDPLANGFGVAELKASVRWSPGEQFARFGYENVSLSTPFPEFWFQASQGVKLRWDAYRYTRLEAKTQWTRRILGFGEMGFHVAAGTVIGHVPYALLFAGRASYKDVSILSYNSFETMRYNEFVSDRYVNVHLTHRFSRMQISTLPYRPYFIFLHNMGWGGVRNAAAHQHILVQDYRKGYYESGLFLNDLFVIPLSGVNLGIGAGAFLRYGTYALPGYLDNVAIKFSASLSL